MFTLGHVLAFAGATLACLACGVGSSIAVGRAGQAINGVLAEAPETKGLTVFQLLPSSQAIYGVLVAFLILLQCGAFGGLKEVSVDAGLGYLLAALPISVVGFASAIWQGNVGNSAIRLLGKRPEAKPLLTAAVVETFAIFALLISALMVLMGVQL